MTSRSQEPRQRFAEELKALREASGESLRQLAEKVGWDFSLFGKMENGHTLGSADVVVALDQYYDTGTLLVTLWEMALGEKAEFKEQYREYMELESEAVSLWHFAVSTVHGLLQTDGYVREVLAVGGIAGEELDQQVEARVGRRALLLREGAPMFRSILSEGVLRTPLRDAKAWREQLVYLVEMADRSNVALQVLPLGVGIHSLVSTDVMFLRLGDGRTRAYTETAYHGELIEENEGVERLQRAYDSVRDLALSRTESRKFIGQMLEEVPCDPSA
ncbi:helix-turn-helix transcriptional regulator [Streptomyces lacrimifluminis]